MTTMAGTTPSHFFKIIRPSTLQDKKLGIPRMFVKKFGNELSTVATLTVPNGGVWKVELMKDGRNIWFHGGCWHEFVEYHSISTGYFLLFRYGKNSNFHVLIFDMSACEIQYPHYCVLENDNQASIPHQDEKIHQDDDSVEIIGSLTANPPAFGPGSETNGCRKPTAASRETPPLFRRDYEARSMRCKMKELMVVEMKKSHSTGEIIGSLAPKPLGFGSASETNSCGKSTALHESPLFRSVYVARSKTRKIEEAVEMDKSDSAGDESELKSKRTRLDEHELFPILEEMGITPKRSFESSSANEKERAIAAAKIFMPKNPSFLAILRPRDLYKGCMYVPSQFAMKYFTSRDTGFIKLQNRYGREWSAKLRCRRCNRGADIMHGWNAFSKDNDLTNGDICMFELTREENLVLKVSVFHSSTTTVL